MKVEVICDFGATVVQKQLLLIACSVGAIRGERSQ